LDVLIAGILHDTLEDTETTQEGIATNFGLEVLKLVQEVTDNKNLPKAVRKELQISHASEASRGAQIIKIADKISNLRDIVSRPPKDWSTDRKKEYLEWSRCVVDGCRGSNPKLEKLYDDIYEKARILIAKTSTSAVSQHMTAYPKEIRIPSRQYNDIESHLRLYIAPDGSLVLEGQDLGEGVCNFFPESDGDYEYWLTLPSEFKDWALLNLIAEHFSGEKEKALDVLFRQWLEEKKIPCKFSSYS
jgi:hypothetical protein